LGGGKKRSPTHYLADDKARRGRKNEKTPEKERRDRSAGQSARE